jgi:hypothetical protein
MSFFKSISTSHLLKITSPVIAFYLKAFEKKIRDRTFFELHPNPRKFRLEGDSHPGFHTRQPMGQRVNHIGHEQR